MLRHSSNFGRIGKLTKRRYHSLDTLRLNRISIMNKSCNRKSLSSDRKKPSSKRSSKTTSKASALRTQSTRRPRSLTRPRLSLAMVNLQRVNTLLTSVDSRVSVLMVKETLLLESRTTVLPPAARESSYSPLQQLLTPKPRPHPRFRALGFTRLSQLDPVAL